MSYMSLQQLLAAQQGALIDSNNDNIADVLSNNLNSIDTDLQSLDGKFKDSNDDNITEVIKAGLSAIAGALGETAADVTYDNTTSGMAATNVQDAIDELDSAKADTATTIAGYGITDAVNLSSLGTVEDEATSSQAYSSGDYFVRNGQMCKAITAISQGATLTEGTNYVSYTIAEILALTSSSAHNYSTTEQIIGTWIDGKILYEKTFSFTSPATLNTVTQIVDISSLQIDSMVDMQGHINNVPLNWFFTASYYASTWWSNDMSSLTMYITHNDFASKNGEVTIQYTKV